MKIPIQGCHILRGKIKNPSRSPRLSGHIQSSSWPQGLSQGSRGRPMREGNQRHGRLPGQNHRQREARFGCLWGTSRPRRGGTVWGRTDGPQLGLYRQSRRRCNDAIFGPTVTPAWPRASSWTALSWIDLPGYPQRGRQSCRSPRLLRSSHRKRGRSTDGGVRAMFQEYKEGGKFLKPEVSAAKLIRIVEGAKFQSGDHVDYFDEEQ